RPRERGEPDVTTPRGPQPFAGQEKRLRLLAFVRQDSVVRVDKRVEDTAMVWPHLLVIEFIAAMLWSIGLFVIAAAFNAPLQDHATPDCTPNPSKAPWYFMNLQELLLHMDKGLAGVIVPTVLLVGLMTVPYIDRDNEGQGGWFATPNAIRITMFSLVWSSVWIIWLILWDNQSHVKVWAQVAPHLHMSRKWLGDRNPFDGWWGEGALKAVWDLVFLKDRLSVANGGWKWSVPVPFQPGSGPHDGRFNWPDDASQVPVPLNGTWL